MDALAGTPQERLPQRVTPRKGIVVTRILLARSVAAAVRRQVPRTAHAHRSSPRMHARQLFFRWNLRARMSQLN
jgi:hypothetical protein